MAEVTNDLMFEVLKTIQVEVSGLREWRVDIRNELQAMRGHMNATSAETANLYSRLGSVEDRLDRIERRLGLVDASVS